MSEMLQFVLSHEEAFKSKARLASLYSDFALLKSTNPDGYKANSAAWRAALEQSTRRGLASNGNVLVLGTGEGLLRQLETEDLGRPLSLGVVLGDAIGDGSMIPLKNYMDATQSVYKKSWVQLPTMSGMAKWLLHQIGVGESSAMNLPKGELVVFKTVEDASRVILEKVSEQSASATSLIYSLDTFTETFGEILQDAPKLSKTDMSVVLKHLSRDKEAIAVEQAADGTITAIKFASPSSQVPPSPITQHDKTIASLQSLMSRLRAQADELILRIAELDLNARKEISANHRERALNALRRRKALEATLKKREESFAQVEGVLTSIDEAAGQVEMVSAMEASSTVLHDLNQQIGGVDRVDAVMEAVREGKEDVDEIGRVLAEPGQEGIDEAEIDEELESLERDAKQADEEKVQRAEEQRKHSLLNEAPNVPEEIGRQHTKTDEDLEKKLGGMTLEP